MNIAKVKEWSKILDKQLIWAYENGSTYQEIGDLLGVTKKQVEWRIVKLINDGQTQPKLKRWTKEETDLLILLHSKGIPDKYVAKALGVTLLQAAKKRGTLGLPVNIDEDHRKMASFIQSSFRARQYIDWLHKRIAYFEKKNGVKVLQPIERMTNKEWIESEVS